MNGANRAYAETTDQVLQRLAVAAEVGLGDDEAARRRQVFGPNELHEAKRRGPLLILVSQFHSVIVYLLAAAAAVSFAFAQWLEGLVIVVVLIINAAIGFLTELRAVHSMAALRRIARVTARVRRNNSVVEIAARDLVPGDIVVLEGGDVTPADLRLVRAAKLQCDEALLTGESSPVAKTTEAVAPDAPVAKQFGMAFKGTSITRGAGDGVVVATGMETQLGRISAMVEAAEAEATPLERRLARLSGQLVWATVILTAVIAVLGIATGKDALLMTQTAIALAVAAVPEGLPIVATMVLARGMWRMARRNALIERLSAVETLGATTVICADKTGTLTENRMTVTHIMLPGADIEVDAGATPFTAGGKPVDPVADHALRRLLEVCVLCNNAALAADGGEGGAGAVGDPMEVALLAAGVKGAIGRAALVADRPEVREEPFDPDVRMMATFHHTGDEYLVAVKGAPEQMLDHVTHVAEGAASRPLSDDDRQHWLERNHQLAETGARLLAVASRTVDRPDAAPYEGLVLLGLVGLSDPPRRDVPDAMAACRGAGMRVVMITGDQLRTARNIAAAVGISDGGDIVAMESSELPAEITEAARQKIMAANVFSRVSPRQKLDLIAMYQHAGEVVAMTGDGVNDAPALKKADIGIAMGRRGSQVAREAADMVLSDDAFGTIVDAIGQGRVIFGNIRKFAFYLLSCNISEILVIGIATLGNMPLPLLPLQILFLNLITDVFPAFALGACEGEPGLMRKPPRPAAESILGRNHWVAVIAYGLLITVVTLAAFELARKWLGMSDSEAVTISFLTLAFAQLWHCFNMRDAGSALWTNEVVRNPYIWGSLALCAGLILAAVYLPGLSYVLRLSPPGAAQWGLILAASAVPLVIGQAVLSLIGRGDGR